MEVVARLDPRTTVRVGLHLRRAGVEPGAGHEANFRVDTILEPEPRPDAPCSQHWRLSFTHVPRTLVMRAREQGI